MLLRTGRLGAVQCLPKHNHRSLVTLANTNISKENKKSFGSRALWTIVPIVGAFGMTIATGIVSVGVWGSFKINRSRTRWFSDSFVLSPESLRMPYKKVNLQTEDGVHLEGWYIEQTVRGHPSDRVVLCCNPYNHDKSTLLAVARALWDTGHSVFLFDFRAFGPNPVPHETIGHLELRDGKTALEWLRANKPKNAKIGLMGCSMGGAVALCLAEESDPSEIVGVATDCAFASLFDVVDHYIKSSMPDNLPGKHSICDLLVYSLATFNHLWYGYDLKNVGPLPRLNQLKVPMLVVHSEKDSIVPIEQAMKIFQGAATPESSKQLVVVKGCEHIGSFFENEIAYTKRIVSFLDKCFEQHLKVESTTSLTPDNFKSTTSLTPEKTE